MMPRVGAASVASLTIVAIEPLRTRNTTAVLTMSSTINTPWTTSVHVIASMPPTDT